MARNSAAVAEPQGFQSTPEGESVSGKAATPFEVISTETALISAVPYTLPIGWFDGDGVRQQAFTLKEYGGPEELELSALCGKHRDQVAEVLPRFLANIVDTIGGVPTAELAKSQSLSAQKLFENMFLADVLQLILQLRLDAIGTDVQLSGRCPSCMTINKDREGEYSDLSTVEVEMVKGMTHPLIEVTVPTGATIFEDKVSRVHVRPVRLYDLKRLAKQQKEGKNNYKINHQILLNTIVALPGCEAYNSSLNSDRSGISEAGAEDFYSRLPKKDRDYLMRSVTKISNYGPAMSVDMICQACGYDDWKAEVPWRDLLSFLSNPAE